jgi:hypothetical protein
MNKVMTGTLRTLNPRARKIAVLAVLAFAGMFTAACSDSNGPQVASTVTISPTSATIAVGGTQQFTAVVKNSKGNVLKVAGIWAVTGGGTITSTGLFTAGSTPGTSTITVSCSGITATATVTVIGGPLVSIVVTPNPGTMPINTALTYTASGRDALGNTVPITGTVTWSVVAGGGTVPAGSTGLTVPFTAGSTPGTFTNTVRATNGTLSGTATAIVTAGPLASIVVTPNPGTMQVNTSLTYTASGRDAGGNTVPITGTVSWTVVNGGGTVPVGATGLTVSFTAGNVAGTFNNTVQASNGTLSGTATAIVTAGPPPPPPPPSGGFTILGRAAVTCSTGSIIGDVGTFQAAGDAPPGSITASCGPVTTGTVHAPGDPASKAAYNNFLNAYIALAPVAGDCNAGNTLVGTLAGVSLTPGTYCFTAAAALTGTLTLNGPPTGVWLFKIGTAGTGDLTGTNFDVIMAGGAVPCNVTWWVRQASAMTTSNFKGTVMAGTGVTFTGGTFIGNGWAGASGSGDATETGTAITGCP